jgi:hypothetical protein
MSEPVQEKPEHHHRRRHRKGIPKIFALLLLLCVAGVVAVFVYQPRHAAVAPLPDRPSVYGDGLTVDQMRFESGSGTKRIAGVVRNSAAQPMRNVNVSLRLWSRANGHLGRTQVVIPLLPAHGEMAFQTPPLAPDVVRWELGELTGDR